MMAPLQKHTRVLDKTTTHLETLIQAENSPVPERRELKAIAEHQDGNLVRLSDLCFHLQEGRRGDTGALLPLSAQSWDLTFTGEPGKDPTVGS